VIHHSEVSISDTWAYSNKWLLLVVAVLVAVSGVVASIAVYAKGKFKIIEPKILADAWRYDAAVSAIFGGPGRAAFGGVAAFDAKVIDGAVNGIGTEVRATSGILRKIQSGLVRSYAFVIGLGAVVILAWFLLRGIL
jgi:NADH-quinone oxidoreductase subunit L